MKCEILGAMPLKIGIYICDRICMPLIAHKYMPHDYWK
jgi:hypothetical protein